MHAAVASEGFPLGPRTNNIAFQPVMMAGYLDISSMLLHRMQTHQHAGPSCRVTTTVIQRGLSRTQGLPVVQRRVVSARANDEGVVLASVQGPVEFCKTFGGGTENNVWAVSEA